MSELKPYGMTVGQLRKALEGEPDDMVIVVRTGDEWVDNGACGGVLCASTEQGCADSPAFLIDASNDQDEFEAAEGEAEEDDAVRGGRGDSSAASRPPRQAPEQFMTTPKPSPAGQVEAVCATCNDTHAMWIGQLDAARKVACTSCPSPCPRCRGKLSAYCAATPCACPCHPKPTAGVAPVAGREASATPGSITTADLLAMLQCGACVDARDNTSLTSATEPLREELLELRRLRVWRDAVRRAAYAGEGGFAMLDQANEEAFGV